MSFVYRDGTVLARSARWALWAYALVLAAGTVLALVPGGDAPASDDLARTLAIARLLGWLVSLILFLVWFHRANANARAMGADGLMGSPGLSVAWFFIPIAFLFMPYIVVRDTWKASESPRDWQGRSAPALVSCWWAAFLVTTVISTVSFRLWLVGDYDVGDAVAVLDMISDVTGIAASLLGAALVAAIQRRQVSPAHLGEHFR